MSLYYGNPRRRCKVSTTSLCIVAFMTACVAFLLIYDACEPERKPHPLYDRYGGKGGAPEPPKYRSIVFHGDDMTPLNQAHRDGWSVVSCTDQVLLEGPVVHSCILKRK